jgi:sterol desaturase/sphingolipid hydroxylase (fatty acid hydroxylase superfamily)
MTGHEHLEVRALAGRLHHVAQPVSALLSSYGVNLNGFISVISRSAAVTSFVPSSKAEHQHEFELLVAKAIIYVLTPVVRFYLALWLADTWVFFVHRAEHSNQWLYSK